MSRKGRFSKSVLAAWADEQNEEEVLAAADRGACRHDAAVCKSSRRSRFRAVESGVGNLW
jgi:hypothetical protein